MGIRRGPRLGHQRLGGRPVARARGDRLGPGTRSRAGIPSHRGLAADDGRGPCPLRGRGAVTLRRASAPELAGLALVVVVQAAACWYFASRSYFVADDFPVFYDAQVRGAFDLGFLGSEVIVHFSPGFRLVSLLVQRYATFD